MTRGTTNEPIEDYLDELLSCLRLPPRATRRLLSECEEHLREAADLGQQRGLDRVDAERAAVEAFGAAARVAADAGDMRRTGWATLWRLSAWSLLTLGGTALAAIGLSGAVAAVFIAVAGPHFVGALPQTYPASVCRYFLTVHHGVASCSGAATLENSSDAVALRLLAGACGGLMLAVAFGSRRFLRAEVSVQRMWNGASAAVAAIAFAVAGAWLTANAVDIAVQHGSGGVGWYLSGSVVSLFGAVAAGIIMWRTVRVLRPWAHVTVDAA